LVRRVTVHRPASRDDCPDIINATASAVTRPAARTLRPPGNTDTEDRDHQMKPPSDASTVLIFSHRPQVREAIINAVGRRPAADVGRLDYVEAGTIAEVLAEVDAGGVDLAILDGEAQPTGGMGLSRQLKNEIAQCPPMIISVQRRDDRWLAVWSQADAVIVHPLDPLVAAETVAEVLRSHRLPVTDD
jgi:DNA-binding NtrC family response regulator